MIGKDDVRDFLMSRRANVTPGQAGLPQDGGDRRVPGLRREEVAMLAGVSTDYYTRLERGDIGNASRSVLEGIARALQLDDVERDHLFDLARNATSDATGHDDTPRSGSVRASVQRLLDNMQVPAVVYNAHQDLVAANLLGRALFAPFETERPNLARFVFLDSRAPDFYEDWPLACSLTAAMLRFKAGRDPLNEELTALIGELSTRSPQFRRHWSDRDVHEHRTGQKTYRHPEVGDLEISYDVLGHVRSNRGSGHRTRPMSPGSQNRLIGARLHAAPKETPCPKSCTCRCPSTGSSPGQTNHLTTRSVTGGTARCCVSPFRSAPPAGRPP